MRLDDKIPERVAVGMSAEISPAYVNGTRMLFSLLSEFDLPATFVVSKESLDEFSEAGIAFRSLLLHRPPSVELAYASPFLAGDSGPRGFYNEFTGALQTLEATRRQGDGRGYMPSRFEAQHGHIRGILEERFKYVLCEDKEDAQRFTIPNMRFASVQEQEGRLAGDPFSSSKGAYKSLDTANHMHMTVLKGWRSLRDQFKQDIQSLLKEGELSAERVAQPAFSFPPRIHGVSLLPYLQARVRFTDQTTQAVRTLFSSLQQMRQTGSGEPITLGNYVTKYLRPEAS